MHFTCHCLYPSFWRLEIHKNQSVCLSRHNPQTLYNQLFDVRWSSTPYEDALFDYPFLNSAQKQNAVYAIYSLPVSYPRFAGAAFRWTKIWSQSRSSRRFRPYQ